MAQYRLIAPHYVTNRLGIPMLKEAGSIIDTWDMPSHWQPTPLMIPLDGEAERAHAEVTRAAIINNGGPAIPGIGNARDLHRGKEHLDATGWADTP